MTNDSFEVRAKMDATDRADAAIPVYSSRLFARLSRTVRGACEESFCVRGRAPLWPPTSAQLFARATLLPMPGIGVNLCQHSASAILNPTDGRLFDPSILTLQTFPCTDKFPDTFWQRSLARNIV